MRLRNIAGSRERIAESEFTIDVPEDHKGKWNEVFGNDNPIRIEVGTGKGRFIMDLAEANPDVNYVGIEKYSSVLLRAVQKQTERQLSNVRFIRMEAEIITEVFEEGEVDRIYLNFSDPWTRQNKPKRRLTYRDFLNKYKVMMREGGAIEFKTDNDDLFDFSLNEFKETGFTLEDVTRDLHNSEWNEENIRTEFEQKFADQGITIKRVVAKM